MRKLTPFALLFIACERLPDLPPENSLRTATTVVVTPLAPIIAGDWGAAELQVLDQYEIVMVGQSVVVRAVLEVGEAPQVSFALGNSCVTRGEPAKCLISIHSEGQAGQFPLVFQSDKAVSLQVDQQVVPARAEARLKVVLGNDTEALWQPSGRDSFADLAPSVLQRGGQDRELSFELRDAYDNALPEQLHLSIINGAEDDPDAGIKALIMLGACESADDFQNTLITPINGSVKVCLRGGQQLGSSALSLRVVELTDGAVKRQGAWVDDLLLPLQTLPVGGLRLLREGLPESQLRCSVGDSVELVVRLVDNQSAGVGGILLRAATSGLTGLAPEEAFTGSDGRSTFRARCPPLRRGDGELRVWVASATQLEVVTPVQIMAGNIASLEADLINDDALQPGALAVGEPSALRIIASDEHDNRVASGQVRLSMADDLAGRIVLTEPACGAETGASLDNLVCSVDADGQITLSIKGDGLLMPRPIELSISGDREQGDPVVIVKALRLVSGLARRATLSPAGRMLAVVGADGGVIEMRTTDSGGNPVADVQVEVSVPEAIDLQPAALRRSDADGRIRWRLAELRSIGEHTLSFRVSLVDGPPEELGLVVVSSAGNADALRLETPNGELQTQRDGQYILQGWAGAAWPRLVLAQRNGAGGLVPGAQGLGLALLNADDQGCDPLLALAAAQFGDDGSLNISGESGVEARFGLLVRSCALRVTVGDNSIELRIEQSPNQPVGGRIEVNEGSEDQAQWRVLGVGERLPGLVGFAQDPLRPSFARRYELRLSQVSDAFGNALAGGQAISVLTQNAWVGPRRPLPAQDGSFRFWVAAGEQVGGVSRAQPGSEQGWDEPPVVEFTVIQGTPGLRELFLRAVDRKAWGHEGNDANYDDCANDRPCWSGGAVSSNSGNAVAVGRNAATDLLLRSSGDGFPASDPDLPCSPENLCEQEDPGDDRGTFLQSQHQRHAQLVEVSFFGVDNEVFSVLANGLCDPNRPCSRARLFWLDDGLRSFAEPVALGSYPLWRDNVVAPGGQNNEKRYRSLIPLADLQASGVFALAIEAESSEGGEPYRSLALPIFAAPKPWLRPRGLVIQAPPGNAAILQRYRDQNALPDGWLDDDDSPMYGRNFARILDVRPVQLDEDEELEILLCGDDAFGGWLAVVNPDSERAERGANPFGEEPLRAIRTYQSFGQIGEQPEWAWDDRVNLGAEAGPRLCDLLASGPSGQPVIVSSGLPSSGRYPQTELYLTPVVDAAPGTPQPLRLEGLSGQPTINAMRFADNGALWLQLSVAQGQNRQRWHSMSVVGSAEHLALTAPQAQADPIAPGWLWNYPSVEIDLDGDRWVDSCVGELCHRDGGGEGLGGRWQGGELVTQTLFGRVVSTVNWGGRQGLIAFRRHSNRLAWYLPHRRSQACAAQNGELVCPAVCGDGELQFGEACEPGAGCGQDCRQTGLEVGAPAAALAVSMPPMVWPDVRLPAGLAASPIQIGLRSDHLMLSSGYDNYQGRHACRKMGGELPSEAQWEGLASGGEGDARGNPWGSSAVQHASGYLSPRNTARIGEHFLGISAEGLADLGGANRSYGEHTLDQYTEPRVRGLAPLRHPQPGTNAVLKGGGTSQRSPSVSAHRASGRSGGDNGAVRCVWSSSAP